MKSVKVRLLEAMVKGKKFSPKQIKDKYGVANPHDVIYQIRKLGVHVVSEESKTGTRYYIIK